MTTNPQKEKSLSFFKMDRPTTPLGSPPRYTGEPPSYSSTPMDDDTPITSPNNGSTMRLLSSAENVDEPPYVSPTRPSQVHVTLKRKAVRIQTEGDESIDYQGMPQAEQDEAGAAIPQWSSSPLTGKANESPKRQATFKLNFKKQSSPIGHPRPTSSHRSYHSPTTSPSRSRSPSILDNIPDMGPPMAEAPSYLPYVPNRASPTKSYSPSTKSYSPSRGSSTSSRPPPPNIPYEPVEINGSPRPGTPSSRYGGSPTRPLPPAPLFSGPQANSRSSRDIGETTTIPINEEGDDGDDVFGPPSQNPRSSLKSYKSFHSESTFNEEHNPKENQNHYGPAPTGRQERRRGARQAQMAKKEVRLINGELILECKIPTILYSFLPRRDEVEFTHMRYTAVTCDPDDFVLRGYKLRQNIGNTMRDTELFICVTMYNEDEIDFTRTMHGVMRNITHFCSRSKSRTWGKDGWQKIVVCIVSDGRQKVHPRTLDALAAMGVYQDGIAKNLVNQREVTAHVYEYTTQVSLDADLKFKGAEKGIVPCQIIFCLKEKNQKKLNSHRWFFNAFGKALSPNVCILLDVGTKPGPKALYHLWKAFDTDSSVAGACGEIVAGKGKGWLGLLNPLVASQNFEYKMSNILDKPLESVFGYITVLPGALSAYRYYALQNDATGHGPLSQYFKGETLHGQNADVFTANMYLAEDRILCWELVGKRDERWVLKYVKSATGETDVPGRSARILILVLS